MRTFSKKLKPGLKFDIAILSTLKLLSCDALVIGTGKFSRSCLLTATGFKLHDFNHKDVSRIFFFLRIPNFYAIHAH